MKKKVLVIGANGFTGRRILNDLSRNDEYIVTGCSMHDDIAPDSGNYRFISADICQMGEQSALFREVRPNVVINTSALSVPDYCEAHREEADSINVNAVGQLAFRCEAPLHDLYIYLPTLYLMEIQGSFIQKKILLIPSTIMGQPN